MIASRKIRRVSFDTNCWIDAISPDADSYPFVNKLIAAHLAGNLKIHISIQSLSEISKPPEVLDLVKQFTQLPHWPIGSWEEQVGSWDQSAGTWDDGRRNDLIQKELDQLAKSGNDIRDRGAYLDALLGGMDAFITSDRQFCGSGPAVRIEERFGLKVLTPSNAATRLFQEVLAPLPIQLNGCAL